MIVLGIGGFMHDYNCCLVDVERKRVAMCEAERQSRRKHHVIKQGDDLLAPVRQCCDDLGVRLKDITTVVFGHTDAFACREWIVKELPGREFLSVDHHLCHAAAGFFTSPYDDALILSLDGFGDGSSGLMAHGRGSKIEELERISEADSIGLEYLRATVHLGLGGYGAEGKTQGLAPYGQPTIFQDYMNEIEILPGGNIRLSPKLRNESSRLAEEGGYLNSQLLMNAFLNGYCQRRIAPEPLTDMHMNLAASVQKVLEAVAERLCAIGKQRSGCRDLVLTGGVSMNSSMNGELLRSGAFRHIYALPMSSDRGTGLGAALYHVHNTLGVPRFFTLKQVFFGQQFGERDAIKAAKQAGLRLAKGEDTIEIAAQALTQSKIVGWFQERSELGARALGHRSILADPRRADMKDIVNARVKHREWFRPFAPSVLDHRAREYFDYPEGVADLTFMTFTVAANARAGKEIPATVHVDKTSRVQTVIPEHNPLYARVIERFGALTGVPVVLNTSFNDKDEPIVESPHDAVAMFLKSDMDVLCMGQVACWKK